MVNCRGIRKVVAEPQLELVVLPDPLHPVIVHFPIVLSVLLPFVAGGALWAIHTGARPIRAWGVATAVAALLTLSAWESVETGEQQERRVKKVVGEERVEEHAEAAQTLLYTSVGVLAVLALGLIPGKRGQVIRYVGVVGTLATAALAFKVGSSGGDLVYKYNAASAYAKPGGTAGAGEGGGAATGERDAKANDDKARETGEKGEKGEQ